MLSLANNRTNSVIYRGVINLKLRWYLLPDVMYTFHFSAIPGNATGKHVETVLSVLSVHWCSCLQMILSNTRSAT